MSTRKLITDSLAIIAVGCVALSLIAADRWPEAMIISAAAALLAW
jgi:hypothetical protein